MYRELKQEALDCYFCGSACNSTCTVDKDDGVVFSSGWEEEKHWEDLPEDDEDLEE